MAHGLQRGSPGHRPTLVCAVALLLLLGFCLPCLLHPASAAHQRHTKTGYWVSREYGEGNAGGGSGLQGPQGAFTPLNAQAPKPPDADADSLAWLAPFVDPLPFPAVIRLDLEPNISMGAYRVEHKFHRDLPPTRVYAFGHLRSSASVPGPTMLAARGTPAHVSWKNRIRDKVHILPIDYTTGAAKPDLGYVPIVPHLHGSTTESASDGHPQAWFTAYGDVGPMYIKQTYTYPNVQPGCTMWYHDHTIGMTRLNEKVGLYGMYILRDQKKETELTLPQNDLDVPLILSDANFDSTGAIAYPRDAEDSLYHTSWRPESFGRFAIVNGKIFPFLEIKRAIYRFRILNGASSRYFNLSFCMTSDNITQWQQSPAGSNNSRCFEDDSRTTAGPHSPADANCTSGGAHNASRTLNCSALIPIVQVATDAGFLPGKISLSHLLLAPANRKEILVDFSAVEAGFGVVLVNTAPIPFPNGGQDHSFPIQHVMLFKPASDTAVVSKMGDPGGLPSFLGGDTFHTPDIQTADNYPLGRNISMTEFYDSYGNVIGDLLEGRRFMDQGTIYPVLGTSEIWSYINLTPDAHPVHFHFLPQQIIDRVPLNVTAFLANACDFDRGGCFTGPPVPPQRHEAGLHDTVTVYPEGVTRVLVGFGMKDFDIPFDPTQGPGYVIHCHILEHEDMDMMRPVKMVNHRPQTTQTNSRGRLSIPGFWTLILLLLVF